MMASALSPLVSQSSLWVWELVEIVGAVIVIIGVWGEFWAERRQFSDDPNDLMPTSLKGKKWEEFFWRILLSGLAVELVGLIFALIVSNVEISGLKKEATDARLETAKLEQQIAQTSTNVDKIDPLNQPILDIFCLLRFKVRQRANILITNLDSPWIASIFLCETNIASFSSYSELEADKVISMPFRLHIVGQDSSPPLPYPSDLDYCAYYLKFHTDTAGDAERIGVRHKTMDAISNVVMLAIFARFLPHDTEVLGGSAEIIINGSVSKEFTIYTQTISEYGFSNSPEFVIIATNYVESDYFGNRVMMEPITRKHPN